MELNDKIALITGSARGIGRAIAYRFAEEGAFTVITDIDMEGASTVLEQIKKRGADGISIKVDVTDEKQVKKLFSTVMEKYHTLDILVNNAGACKNIPILEITPDEWDTYVNINLRSVFLCSREAFRIMKEKGYGKIINMGSMAAKIGGIIAGAHYSAAKAGVLCFTKSLALQSAAYNINVNAIAPGPVSTKMTEEWGEEINRAFMARIPFKRYASPEEVAEVALFLASEKSKYITGEIIDINGGMFMD